MRKFSHQQKDLYLRKVGEGIQKRTLERIAKIRLIGSQIKEAFARGDTQKADELTRLLMKMNHEALARCQG